MLMSTEWWGQKGTDWVAMISPSFVLLLFTLHWLWGSLALGPYTKRKLKQWKEEGAFPCLFRQFRMHCTSMGLELRREEDELPYLAVVSH